MSAFRDLLDEAIGPVPPTTVDIDRALLRARRQAWIRPLVGTIVVAVLATAALAVVSVVAVAENRTAPPVGPPVSPDLELLPPVTPGPVQIAYFPEYLRGAEIIAEQWGPLSLRPIELTFVPSVPQEELSIFVRCDPAGEKVVFDMAVGLHPGSFALEDVCGDEDEEAMIRVSPGWARFATVDKPSRITLRITGRDSALPPGGTFGIAVGEPVPFDEYPLPPAPPSLEPLDPEPDADLEPPPGAADVEQHELWADPDDPAAARSLTLDWSADLQVAALAQTPGQLHVAIDGDPVGTVTVWDYEQHWAAWDLGTDTRWRDEVGRRLAEGEEATITVVPEHMTGDWVVSVVT